MARGMIHIYCGDGKGKTTAAVGLAVRHRGFGGRVLFAQFLKSGDSAELNALEDLGRLGGLRVISGKTGDKFTFQMDEDELKECINENNQRLGEIKSLEKSGDYSMIILDECIGAFSLGLIDEELLKDFLVGKREETEIILTGRDPAPWLLELADYVSEIKKIKHPFDKGIGARKGIEY